MRQAPAIKGKESKSAAVRAALANPSKRQLSRWQRERRQRRLILYLGIGLTVLVAVVLAFGYWREMIARPNEPAAVVGPETIPIGALAQRVKPQIAALDNEIARLSMQLPTSSGSPSTPDQSQRQVQALQNQRSNAADQVLTDMIDEELVRAEALRRGLTVTPEEIEARINQELAKARMPTSQDPNTPQAAGPALAGGPTPTPTPPPTLTASEFEDEYNTLLQRINYTDQQFRAYTEAIVQRDKLRDALVADVPRVQEQVHARRLTVATQEEATAALAAIHSGEQTLEDLARDKSLDLLSKQAGGDLGWLPRGVDSPQFDDAAFLLREGEVGEPVVSPQGWE